MSATPPSERVALSKRRGAWLRWTRVVHAYAALLIGASTLFYALSGFVLIHGARFETKPKGMSSVEQVELAPDTRALAARGDEAGPELVAHLIDRYGARFNIGGETDLLAKNADGSWNIAQLRPTRRVELVLQPNGTMAVGVQQRGPVHSFGELHHMSGYQGPAAQWLWAFLVDVTAVSMIGFALSGVAMWWLTKPTRAGGLCLFVGLAYPLGSLAYFVLAP